MSNIVKSYLGQQTGFQLTATALSIGATIFYLTYIYLKAKKENVFLAQQNAQLKLQISTINQEQIS